MKRPLIMMSMMHDDDDDDAAADDGGDDGGDARPGCHTNSQVARIALIQHGNAGQGDRALPA